MTTELQQAHLVERETSQSYGLSLYKEPPGELSSASYIGNVSLKNSIKYPQINAIYDHVLSQQNQESNRASYRNNQILTTFSDDDNIYWA
ncbi:hypothetical protein AB751O23_BO_00060 [Chlamydiales bacterium SCGC AB-751-O23]|nr:hypothetical protein AB751O23_BO_00060 [Chlamydiales bacterium SCGC AB-751-O23]